MSSGEELARILREREQQYGPWRSQAQSIAKSWSEYTGVDLLPVDVAMMMILFKVSRGISSRDTFLDIAGYALLAADDGS